MSAPELTTEQINEARKMAVLVRARTKQRGSGRELGEFTDETRPTLAEAWDSYTDAEDEVDLALGTDIPDAPGTNPEAFREAAIALKRLLGAMNIESSFYPEQIETGRSNYPALERRYNAALKRALAAIDAAGGTTSGDGEEGDTASTYKKPSFNFGDHDVTSMDEPF